MIKQNIRKKIKATGTIALSLLLFTSCSDFLKEYSQDTDYVRSWRDLDELLIGSGYQNIFSADNLGSTSDNQYFIHFLADELDEYTGPSYDENQKEYDGKERVFGYYTWQARSGQLDTFTGFNKENDSWAEYYKLINVANNVIESANELKGNSEDQRKGKLKVCGEAHFLRGYYYFMLTNFYGKAYDPATAATDLAVPIKTSQEVEDKFYSRNTVQECYDLILSDLLLAEKELAEYGTQTSKYRASTTAVHLLLSRVYLYMQNWEKAAEYAQKVIDEHPALANLRTMSHTAGIISETSPELIFSMGSTGVMEYTMNHPKSFTITNDIYNLYSNDDLRKTQYIWTNGSFHGYKKIAANAEALKRKDPDTNETITEDNAKYYFTAYYYGLQKQTNDVSDKNYMRSSEAYLNLAEALAYMGKETEARNAVNSLRKYRFAEEADYQLTSTGNKLIEDIRDERERELLLEGHRWFDLRRYAVNTKYQQKKEITHHYYYFNDREDTKPASLYTFTLKADDWGWTLPLPQSVIDFNIGMPQNQRGERVCIKTTL
jgi:hypothetical protein